MPDRTRACLDCGSDITRRHHNAKRCHSCSADAKRRAMSQQAPARGVCFVNDEECVPGRLRRGYCSKHYTRQKRYGAPVLPERTDQFTRYRVTNTECWEWTGPTTPNGYGHGGEAMGDRVAHRAFYKRFVGPIPDGLELDHLCRNRPCVNPKHLEPVTRSENLRRGVEARREGRCIHDLHDLLTDDDWYTDPSTGSRRCKGCWRESYRKAARAYQERKAVERGEVYVPPTPRKANHCRADHEFTPENTYWPPGGGSRQCRECNQANRARRTERERGGPPPDRSRCHAGHLWTAENTYLPPSGRSRQCRACNQRRESERAERRRRAAT